MPEHINPAGIMAPYNNAYTHAVVIPPNARVLHMSGQVGAAPDGSVPDGIEAQAENVWKNITAILAEANMGVGDIVKQTAFIVGLEHFPGYAAVRKKYIGDLDPPPASTAVCITQLVLPELLIEVELVAAKSN